MVSILSAATVLSHCSDTADRCRSMDRLGPRDSLDAGETRGRDQATGIRFSTVTVSRAHTGGMAAVPRVGDLAPDFTLPGWYDGEASEFTLSSERGHPVVLAFYPRDHGAVCTRQLTAYSDELGGLTATGATLWAISPQDLHSKAAFAGAYGLKLPLLADVDLAVARAYGVDCRAEGGDRIRRAVVVVDTTGTIAWMHVSRAGCGTAAPPSSRRCSSPLTGIGGGGAAGSDGGRSTSNALGSSCASESNGTAASFTS